MKGEGRQIQTRKRHILLTVKVINHFKHFSGYGVTLQVFK